MEFKVIGETQIEKSGQTKKPKLFELYMV